LESIRGSYGSAVERLNSLAAGGRPVPLAGVGDELLGVARMLEHQPGLRRTLADPSRTGEDRAGLLDSLLDGKVSEDTRALLRLLVAGRWSTPTELLTATERLGIEALLASAESAGELADVADELFRFSQIIDGDLALASALGSSTAPVAGRVGLARELLDRRAQPVTIRLVELALQGFGGRNFIGGMTRLVEYAAERQDRQLAFVTVASRLTDAQADALQATLARRYGRQVDLKVAVDPEVVGGARVRVDSDLYDATVQRRLAEARAALGAR
jgi:F-type H+-transporting ATPase subunit delta